MATATPAEFLPAFVADLAAAIEAVGGSTTLVSRGGSVTGGWTIELTLTGALRGTARLTLDLEGVKALLHLVLGDDADSSDLSTGELLRELSGQAVSALRTKVPFAGTSISVGSIAAAEAMPEQRVLFSITFGNSALQIAAAASLEVMHDDAPAPAPPSRSKASAARKNDIGPLSGLPTGNLDVVLDIELPLSVRFGSTVMSIRSLSALGPGSIVDMGRSPDDPVEVLVCGRVIARAEVVIVGGRYGVRITDLTSAAERLRALEGQW